MEFRMLGTLEVYADGNRLTLGGAKQRALLAVLLLKANEVVSSDRLIDDLWGETPPTGAGKALQVHVSQLRKVLRSSDGDRAPLVTRPRGYLLEVDPGRLDVRRFESMVEASRKTGAAGDAETAAAMLREALDLWRGPPLADFTYEAFAQPAIAHLTELRLRALEERIELDLALGRHAEVLPELETLVAEHRLRESLRGQLMIALYRAGRQAEALEAYRDGRRLMVDELGIEPDRALDDLHGAILRHDPALDPETAPAPPDEEATPAADVLVGREAQVNQLRRGLDQALGGRGSVFMIGGSAGIGKSRLADELARDARERGAGVLWGRCWEGGGAPAFWPWVQVLRSVLQRRGGTGVGSRPGVGAAALAELVPELGLSSDDPSSQKFESEGARFQLFDAVSSLLGELADAEPLVIVLDDLHAADTPSLLLLQFLAGQMARSRLVLVGLYRDDDLHDERDLTACLAAVAREPTTSRMRLTGLTGAGTATLIESVAGRRVAESVSRRIQAETDGNPLFVGEIVRLLEAEGRLEPASELPSLVPSLPETVTEVISQRLQGLGTSCRVLIGSASILGREFGLKELAAISDFGEDAVLEILDEAMAARVLTRAAAVDHFRFSHALVRETLYAALPAAQRRDTHRAAGEALESLYAADPEPHLTELAHHFFEALPAGDPGRALDYARRAGRRASQLLGYEEAVRLYGLALRALDLVGDDAHEQRCELLLALGDARARAGDEAAARATFLEAADAATRGSRPLDLAQAALGYGGRFVWARAYDDAHLIPLLERALRALPEGAPAVRARLTARLAGALRDHQSRERRASLSAQAVTIARDLGDPATLAYALDGHYSALMWPENPDERLAIAGEIVALAEQVSDDEREIQGRIYRVIAALELGRMAEVETELEITARRAAALRQPAQLWFAAAMRAVLALFQGRFDEAEALMAGALTLGERAQRRDAVLSHRLQCFMLWRETGRPAGIEQLLERTVSEFPTRPVFRCALACLHADSLHREEAERRMADLADDDFAAIQRDNEYLFSLSLLADSARDLGQGRAAGVLYDLLAPYAGFNASNADELATGSVSRPLGVLAAAMGRWDHAAAHFDAALTENAAMGARPWVAHSRHDYARMLLARDGADDRQAGRELLTEALREYEALGMTPWAHRARDLSAQTGLP